MSGELKPCPFCGGEDIRWFSGSNFVGCFRCMARTATDGTDTAKQDCIAAWNTRAQDRVGTLANPSTFGKPTFGLSTTPSQGLDAATVERLRIEREGYRQIAISEGWSWALERAYGREEYLRQRTAEVDDRLANRIEKGWDRDAALATDPHQHGEKS